MSSTGIGISRRRPVAATVLADFAASLRYDDLPRTAVERASHCLIDAVACAIYGARFPWSRIALEQTSLDPKAGFLPLARERTPGAVRAPHVADLMQAQYSVPYCTAMGAYRDLTDPDSIAEDVLTDAGIRRLAEATRVEPKRDGETKGWGVDMTVTLRDGRTFEDAIDDLPGCPATPFSIDRLRAKFRALTKSTATGDRLFDRLAAIETAENARTLLRVGD